jgi:UPF0716 family protein affecting phage T7 exclusion
MRIGEMIQIAASALALAVVAWLLMALPGFVSDRASTVPVAAAGGSAP